MSVDVHSAHELRMSVVLWKLYVFGPLHWTGTGVMIIEHRHSHKLHSPQLSGSSNRGVPVADSLRQSRPGREQCLGRWYIQVQIGLSEELPIASLFLTSCL